MGIFVFFFQAYSANANRDLEEEFSNGKNKHTVITTFMSSSLIGLAIGSQHQIVTKYIDDIYQCLPVLNQYKQKHEVLYKLLLLAQSFGLFLGCLTAIVVAGSTGFSSAMSELILFNGEFYGSKDEIYKKKMQVEKLIAAQYNYHHWIDVFMVLIYISSALIIYLRFKEIDKDGRLYASKVFKDGLLVPTLPDMVEFLPD